MDENLRYEKIMRILKLIMEWGMFGEINSIDLYTEAIHLYLKYSRNFVREIILKGFEMKVEIDGTIIGTKTIDNFIVRIYFT